MFRKQVWFDIKLSSSLLLNDAVRLFYVQNAKQAAKVLERCNAMLRSSKPVSFTPGHQLADNQYRIQGAVKTNHSSNLPDVTTSHDHIPSSLPYKSDHAHSMQDIFAEDCINDDKLLPMRKRPFSAIDTSEAPTKHAAPPQNHSQRIITPREAFVRQTAAESSATASHARNLSASQAAQPSKPRQMYNSVAMDPSIILQQAGAMANAAEVTAVSYLKTSPQAATETQAQAHGPPCTQTCFPTDAQQSTEAFSFSPAPCDVGIGTRTTDFHDASSFKQQATAVPKAQTQAQQNILVGLLYHYTATRGPEWMLRRGATA